MHELPIGKQNEAHFVRLLRARYRILGRIKVSQGIYFWIAIILPVISISLAYAKVPGQPVFALVALAATVLDMAYLDPKNKKQTRLAARVQEEFDCGVLVMPWNDFVADRHPREEEYGEFASRLFSPDREKKLLDWHATDMRSLSSAHARFVCQCVNLWYDRTLREKYLRGLKIIGVVATVLFVIAGMLAGSFWGVGVDGWILEWLVPLGPVIQWFTREIRRHSDTVGMLDHLAKRIEAALIRPSMPVPGRGADEQARMFQDAIFNHRATSPVLYDVIYFRFRDQLESGSKSYAQDLVNDLARANEGVSP
jgi:hypothetical protein